LPYQPNSDELPAPLPVPSEPVPDDLPDACVPFAFSTGLSGLVSPSASSGVLFAISFFFASVSSFFLGVAVGFGVALATIFFFGVGSALSFISCRLLSMTKRSGHYFIMKPYRF